MYAAFQESYYEKGERNPIPSISEFEKTAQIIVMDPSKQKDDGATSTVDVSIELETSEDLTGVAAYCLLIHDRFVEYVPFTRGVRKLV